MKKRVTIKDIAREAGVSVATVSYVLNDRQDQKISEATRNRVLHIVNLMGYTGSRSARALVTGKTGCVAICSFAEDGSLLQAEHMLIIRALSRELEKAGYSAIYHCADRPEKLSNADAIICIDACEDTFSQLSQHNFIPIISMNMVVDDPLFYQVNFDYAAVQHRAQELFGFDFCVVVNDTGNESLKRRISDICGRDVYFCRSVEELAEFLKANGQRPLVVCSQFAFSVCKAAGANATLISPDYASISAKTLELLGMIFLRKAGDRHDVLVFE